MLVRRELHALPPASYVLPPTFCLLPSASAFYLLLLPSTFYLLPSTFYLLPSAFCLLPRAFCLVPRASCSVLRASCFVLRASCFVLRNFPKQHHHNSKHSLKTVIPANAGIQRLRLRAPKQQARQSAGLSLRNYKTNYELRESHRQST
ncbi:hypothetical protein CNO08_23235 [Lysobacter capsici]|nr:hypothetical protein CNO08_23235 [Lysobacter capsici]